MSRASLSLGLGLLFYPLLSFSLPFLWLIKNKSFAFICILHLHSSPVPFQTCAFVIVLPMLHCWGFFYVIKHLHRLPGHYCIEGHLHTNMAILYFLAICILSFSVELLVKGFILILSIIVATWTSLTIIGACACALLPGSSALSHSTSLCYLHFGGHLLYRHFFGHCSILWHVFLQMDLLP